MQEDKKIRIHNNVEHEYQYIIYQPKKGISGKLPLIVFLHGAGERGDNINDVKKHGIPKIFDTDVDYPCIAVSPQCPKDTFWVAELSMLKAFIEEICENYPVDKSRIYLTGISMGGYGTWYMAMAYPDMFAAIAPVCGGGMPWNAGVLKMPIWAFHGEIDCAVNVQESRNMVEKASCNNENVKLTVFPNVGHNAWDYAYNDELIVWLLEQKKNM